MSALDPAHRKRVRQELVHVGMTAFALYKPSSKFLAHIIHEHEHIEAVAYSPFGFASPMLVATSARVIYLAKRPGTVHTEDIAYDVVAGIKSSFGPIFGSLTLHTRIQDYELEYVFRPAAMAFVDFIEAERLERLSPRVRPMPNWERARESQFAETLNPETPPAVAQQQPALLTPTEIAFLTAHDYGVLSTLAPGGEVMGAAIYYLANEQGGIHIVTRMKTHKAMNIMGHHQVALTIFDENPARTLQLEGAAEIEADQAVRDDMLTKIMQPRLYKKGRLPSPVASLVEAGGYVVLRITPTSAAYHPYQSGAD